MRSCTIAEEEEQRERQCLGGHELLNNEFSFEKQQVPKGNKNFVVSWNEYKCCEYTGSVWRFCSAMSLLDKHCSAASINYSSELNI